jgi:uncharacterized heparinase superfamily protein
MIADRVTGSKPTWMRSHVHVHPEVEIELQSEKSALLTRGGRSCTIVFDGDGRLQVEPSWYFPEFGRRLDNQVLVLTARGVNLVSGFCMAAGNVALAFDLATGATVDGETFRW